MVISEKQKYFLKCRKTYEGAYLYKVTNQCTLFITLSYFCARKEMMRIQHAVSDLDRDAYITCRICFRDGTVSGDTSLFNIKNLIESGRLTPLKCCTETELAVIKMCYPDLVTTISEWEEQNASFVKQ